jgi:hypothetical protein
MNWAAPMGVPEATSRVWHSRSSSDATAASTARSRLYTAFMVGTGMSPAECASTVQVRELVLGWGRQR